MAMDKRRATPCLSLRLVVWNAPLISYNLVAARNRSLNAPCALACPALPHAHAQRARIVSHIRPLLSSDSESRRYTRRARSDHTKRVTYIVEVDRTGTQSHNLTTY